MSKRGLGREGERVVANYLGGMGWQILDRNYYSECGEIDLIAKDGEVLVFVEVKSWGSYGFSDLEYSLDRKKCERIVDGARSFLVQHEEYEDAPIRFDVVYYDPRGDYFEHIVDAFTETGKL